MLDEHTKERFDRQIRVGKVGLGGQEKLADSTVLIVGCGALGTYTAEQLCRAGVGQLILVDFDSVELSNLQRQSLFTEQSVGHSKVEQAKTALEKINHTCKITAFNRSFDQLYSEDLGQIDLVLDCTDNFLVRELINDFCLHYQLPFVFASAAGTSGQVMAINPSQGPCLSCIFPNLSELEANCETIGVMTPLIPLISSLQVSLAMQLLMGHEVDFESMKIVNAWSLEISHFKVKKRKACKICQTRPDSAETESKLELTCGNVYKSIFPSMDFDKLLAYSEQHQYRSLANSLACRIKLTDKQEITAFQNGRILFYNFTEADSSLIFEELKEVFS